MQEALDSSTYIKKEKFSIWYSILPVFENTLQTIEKEEWYLFFR
jgi:hypothetical protein